MDVIARVLPPWINYWFPDRRKFTTGKCLLHLCKLFHYFTL